MTDTPAMNSDDYLLALTATRDAIVADLLLCESMRDKAALYNRLESVLQLIKAATPEKRQEVDAVDEIAKRRSARRSGAPSGSPRSKRSS